MLLYSLYHLATLCMCASRKIIRTVTQDLRMLGEIVITMKENQQYVGYTYILIYHICCNDASG